MSHPGVCIQQQQAINSNCLLEQNDSCSCNILACKFGLSKARMLLLGTYTQQIAEPQPSMRHILIQDFLWCQTFMIAKATSYMLQIAWVTGRSKARVLE